MSRLSLLCLLIPLLLLDPTPGYGRNERKAANKSFAQGDYESAAADILTWCRKKPKDREGHKALLLIVPKTFAVYMDRARTAEADGKWEEVIANYKKSILLARNVGTLPPLYGKKNTLVKPPQPPPNLHEEYELKRKAAAEYCYARAISLESQGRHEEAAEFYRRANTFVEGYRGADQKARHSADTANTLEAQQHYFEAVHLIQQRAYRKAYFSLQESVEAVPGYQDAEALMDIARQRGQVTIAVLPTETVRRFADESNAFAQKVVSVALASENPFIKLIDHATLSGMVGAGALASIGRLTGAPDPGLANTGLDLIVLTEVTNLTEARPRPSVERIGAYEWMIVQGGFRSRPVTVTNFSEEVTVTLEVQLKIVDPLTSQVLDAAEVVKQGGDSIRYSKCNCNPKLLYATPAGRSVGETIAMGVLGKFALAPFAAREQLRSTESIRASLEASAASEVVNRLLEYVNTGNWK